MSFSFLDAWFLREANYRWLKEEEKRRNSAKLRGLTECIRCGFCCVMKTCVPTPDELPSIAEFLDLTIEELINRYMVGDEFDDHYFLRFANTKQTDLLGQFLSDFRTYDKSPCLLLSETNLENGLLVTSCKIYPVRPKDAKDVNCWQASEENEASAAIRAWGEGDLQRLCPDMILDGNWDEGW